MSEFYSGVNIVGIVKKAMEVFLPRNVLENRNVIGKRGVTTMLALSIVLTKQVVLTEKTSSNIKKRTRTTGQNAICFCGHSSVY
jgi:hypothetical protein